METVGALIFDFDGVIADSEAIANSVLAEIVTDLGHSTTLDQALDRYSGRRWEEAMASTSRLATAFFGFFAMMAATGAAMAQQYDAKSNYNQEWFL